MEIFHPDGFYTEYGAKLSDLIMNVVNKMIDDVKKVNPEVNVRELQILFINAVTDSFTETIICTPPMHHREV